MLGRLNLLKKTTLRGLLGLLLIILFPTLSHAANVLLSGNGTKAMGRADAVVASGDDVYGIHYNPANLSRLRGFGVRLDGYMSSQSLSFHRRDEKINGKTITYEEVAKEERPFWIPFFALWFDTGRIGQGHFILSLFAYGPHGLHDYQYPEKKGECRAPKDPKKEGDAHLCKKMPEPGPQRMRLIYTRNPLGFGGLAAAYEWKFSDDFLLRLGGAFKLSYAMTDQRLAVVASSALADPRKKTVSAGEALMSASCDGFFLAGDLGVTLELPRGFSLAFSFFFPTTATLHGEIQVEITELAGSLAKIYGKEMTMEVPLPAILRSGLAWHSQHWVLELSFIVELWGETPQYVAIRPKNVRFEALGKSEALKDVLIEQKLHNSYSLRFGLEYRGFKFLSLRTGFLWESGATDIDRLSVATIDYPDKIAFSAGLTFPIPATTLSLDLAFMYFLPRTITVSNSALRPIDLTPDLPLVKGNKPLPSTSNGTYHYGIAILGLGIKGSWGN